jgi:hypothetical protein
MESTSTSDTRCAYPSPQTSAKHLCKHPSHVNLCGQGTGLAGLTRRLASTSASRAVSSRSRSASSACPRCTSRAWRSSALWLAATLDTASSTSHLSAPRRLEASVAAASCSWSCCTCVAEGGSRQESWQAGALCCVGAPCRAEALRLRGRFKGPWGQAALHCPSPPPRPPQQAVAQRATPTHLAL